MMIKSLFLITMKKDGVAYHKYVARNTPYTIPSKIDDERQLVVCEYLGEVEISEDFENDSTN